MDSKMKTALAVIVGVVIGVTLLGSAIALPAAFHAIAFRSNAVGVTDGYGMMGQQRAEDAYGMMGPRGQVPQGDYGTMGPRGGQAPQWDGGVCPDGSAGPNGAPGMMGPRGNQSGPQDGTGVCPNGGICPNTTDVPTSES
ncbi:MAG: hypothetical protein Q7W51_00185 [Coriobacteriia bacterium]|nr:hypothetical protein [Coriobacteriia bacterium]